MRGLELGRSKFNLRDSELKVEEEESEEEEANGSVKRSSDLSFLLLLVDKEGRGKLGRGLEEEK